MTIVSPQFHRHNFIDRKHSKLNFSFLQFSILEEADSLLFNVTDLDSEKGQKYLLPFRNNSEILRSHEKYSKELRNALKIHYLMSTRYAHKLRIDPLKDSDCRKYGWRKTPDVSGGKEYRVCLKTDDPERYSKVMVRIPSTVPQYVFRTWITDNVPDAVKIEAKTGRSLWKRYSGLDPDPWTAEQVQLWIDKNSPGFRMRRHFT